MGLFFCAFAVFLGEFFFSEGEDPLEKKNSNPDF